MCLIGRVYLLSVILVFVSSHWCSVETEKPAEQCGSPCSADFIINTTECSFSAGTGRQDTQMRSSS